MKQVEFIDNAQNVFQKLKVFFAQNVILQHFDSAKVIKFEMNILRFAERMMMSQ
jgi:hypothetical protein